jgi:hypothetical protein
MKNILTPSNGLEMGSYKIKDVERLIADQECKMKHSTNTSRLSMLAAIGSVLWGYYSVYCVVAAAGKCCRKCWPRFVKWFTDTDIVHSSTDTLNGRGMTLRLTTNVKDTAESEGDAAELTPINVVTPRTTRRGSKKLYVGKRWREISYLWVENHILGILTTVEKLV